MTLDEITDRAKGYRVADRTGEHNFGEVMEHLKRALEEIADPRILPSDGDPVVLRNRAREALGIEKLPN